jgi:hypothetical protein
MRLEQYASDSQSGADAGNGREGRTATGSPGSSTPSVARALLDHPYYNQGLRFQIAAHSSDGIEIPLVDGGAFDWVAKLTSNRRAAYVASGLGSQIVAQLFRRPLNSPE